MKTFALAILLALKLHQINAQERSTIEQLIFKIEDLSEFGILLQQDGLHRAFLNRQMTFFAPTNKALQAYKGKRDENLILNHMANLAIETDQFGEKLSTLVTGNPPIWITKNRKGIFLNQAQVTEANMEARSPNGDQQILHIIDSVLEPLVPISLRDSKYLVDLTAQKLLQKSTLYELDGHTLRVFHEQAQENDKLSMFSVPGQHTFFMPIDEAFEVSRFLTGHDHTKFDRNKKPIIGPKIKKEFVDARVLEGHIVPYRLMFTSFAPTNEYKTVAWLDNSVQVNVSLQPLVSLDDDFPVNRFSNQDEIRGITSFDDNSDERQFSAMVRSNTIVGDRIHARGMVVARIIKGNIPVANGVVHLIDKPLMVVSQSLHEYILEEGRQPGNRLTKFARLLKDKGGSFAEAILEARDGTLFAPSNDAFDKVDQEALDYILGSKYLRSEMLGLHFVRERITSNDKRILANGEQIYSAPAALANNRVWFHYSPRSLEMTVEARGVNATVLEKDIGTVNGVIHVVDRILGIPYRSIAETLASDPLMSHMNSLLRQTRLASVLSEDPRRSPRRFTLIVPSNQAWEKAEMHFTKAYNTITGGQFPEYVDSIMERHLKIFEKPLTYEDLVEMTRQNPRRVVPMLRGELTFTQLGEFEYSAYKDNLVQWKDVKSKIVRPNIHCTNGYIHIIDTALIDDTPPWAIQDQINHANINNSSWITPMCLFIYLFIFIW